MTSLKTFLTQSALKQSTLTPITVRIDPTDISAIDGIADQTAHSRQEILAQFIKAGLNEAKATLNPDLEEVSTADSQFHLLNTNKGNSLVDHEMMLREEIAAAFYGNWKLTIDKIKKGDVVYLYENGKGIVAFGYGTGKTLVRDHDGNKDECHYQILDRYKRLENPLSAGEIREILLRDIPFARTRSGIHDGGKLLDHIKKK